MLIGVNGGAPVLLQNRAGRQNHWLGLKLHGTKCNRDGIGARIRWSVGGVVRSKLKNSGGSYLSSHDPREVLGIGAARKIDWLEGRSRSGQQVSGIIARPIRTSMSRAAVTPAAARAFAALVPAKTGLPL